MMQVILDSRIEVRNPTLQFMKWCKDNLIFTNPEFIKKQRMGFYTGSIPKNIVLYEKDGDTIFVPYGMLNTILRNFDDYQKYDNCKRFEKHPEYYGDIPLYDYQIEAVDTMMMYRTGVLQSPAGSGKTQMGLGLIARIGTKALWLTHTKDLLKQSKERAELYFDKSKLGTITEGKVNIGDAITFATIQTMSKLELSLYKNTWNVIIIDECHRASGTPTKATQFSRVLNSLCARYKYGLSATVHRSDGLIKTTFALLGDIVHNVPDEAVSELVIPVTINPLSTGIKSSYCYVDTDGMIQYQKLIRYLCCSDSRNKKITDKLVSCSDNYNLILSDRVNHLKDLYHLLPEELRKKSAVIDGKTSKKLREKAIQDIRIGKNHYLFATYSLAKEGLDIPRLDRLHLVTPQKDYAIVIQSVGRVARKFETKEESIVYDYVDDGIRLLVREFRQRMSHYRKLKCTIKE